MKKALLFSIRLAIAAALLPFSNYALAFTLIELPDASDSPSASITDSTTFNTQIRPVVGAIQSYLLDARHSRKSRSTAAQGDSQLASNFYSETMSDAGFIKVSSHNDDGGAAGTLWLNSTSSSFENSFPGTKHNGDQHMLLAGFDFTASDRVIFGFAVSFETSNVNTEFNLGHQEMDGFSINPYLAYLISDAWSLDVGLGYGEFETDQYRTPIPLLLPITVNSNFDSTRDYFASNLSYGSIRGNWYLTGWLGILLANKDQDSYEESDATAVKGQSMDMELWSLGAEAAYGSGAAETYVSLIYEVDNELDEIKFATGEQPENDDDSLLLSLGWRYYGDDIIANIELISRLGADDVSENSISTTMRIDL